MFDFLDLLARLGHDGLRLFWLPLAVWTVACLPLALAVRALPHTHALHRFQAYRALLWALPLSLLAAALIELPQAWRVAVPAPAFAVVPIAPLPPSGVVPEAASEAFAWTWEHTLGAALLLTLTAACVQAVRLIRDAWALRTLRRAFAQPLPDALSAEAARLSARAGLAHTPVFAHAEAVSVPFTFGWRQPVVVVPSALLAQSGDLRAALLHELAHVRHRDFLWHSAERVLRALFVWHPLVGWVHERLDRARESARDAEVLAHADVEPRAYAELLLRFADPSPTSSLAVGMASKTPLHERFLAMKDPKDRSALLSISRVGLAVAVLLVGIVVTLAACTDLAGPDVDAPEDALQAEMQEIEGQVYMIVEDPPHLIGGLNALQEEIEYPTIARKAGIEGTVFLQFVVGPEGQVINPEVVRGIGAGCDEEALRAVRKMRFTPGKQSGVPVNVRFQLPVRFRLNEGETAKPKAMDLGPTRVPGVEGEVYTVVSTPPQLQGGIRALTETLDRSKAPAEGGTVFVEFVVDEGGEVIAPRVVKGLTPDADAEALRAVRTMRFSPGQQNGQQVKVRFQLPIRFKN